MAILNVKWFRKKRKDSKKEIYNNLLGMLMLSALLSIMVIVYVKCTFIISHNFPVPFT